MSISWLMPHRNFELKVGRFVQLHTYVLFVNWYSIHSVEIRLQSADDAACSFIQYFWNQGKYISHSMRFTYT